MLQGKEGTLPLLAIILSVVILSYSYHPVLKALLDPGLQFHYGDFQTKTGPDSAALRKEAALYTYTNGEDNLVGNIRFFTLGVFASLSDIVSFSDTQFIAALILASMLLGCLGIYLLVMRFEGGPASRAALILFLSVFYFLNFWAVDRLAHTWIWITYAIFPLFVFLGLECIRSPRKRTLTLYSLLFSFFGFLPHSFMYLLMIHGILVVYCLISRMRGPAWPVVFAIVPLVIYAGINMPAIAMFPYLKQVYPFAVDKESPYMLSRHGELENVLSISNPWWPQIPYEEFSIPYRASGLLIFALASVLAFIAFRARRERALLVLSALAVFGFIFVAQGMKNPVMEILILRAVDFGLGQILGLLREWGRISIMVPVFLSIIAIIGVSALKGRGKIAALAILGALVAVNVITSPSWAYMRLYGAIYLPDEYSAIASNGTEKTLLFITEYVSDHNYPVQTYTDYTPIGRFLEKGRVSDRVLDALNIGTVFQDENATRALAREGCVKKARLLICPNDGNGMLSVYGGTIAAPNQTAYLDAVLLGTGGNFAVSAEGAEDVFIFEAERDFVRPVRKTAVAEDWGWSGGRALLFTGNQTIARGLEISRPGNYMLSLRGEGRFLVRVGDSFRRIDSGGGNFSYFGPLDLSAGKAVLRIGGDDGSALDAVWLYPSDSTLEEMFPAPRAKILSQSRVTPALWKAEADAEAPFILSLAEPYNSLFEARITDESGNTEIVRPFGIQGGINGFNVNRTGKLDIEIRFVPQDAFVPAFASTILTILACAASLVFWKS